MPFGLVGLDTVARELVGRRSFLYSERVDLDSIDSELDPTCGPVRFVELVPGKLVSHKRLLHSKQVVLGSDHSEPFGSKLVSLVGPA